VVLRTLPHVPPDPSRAFVEVQAADGTAVHLADLLGAIAAWEQEAAAYAPGASGT
jgi:hypothetical protein